MSMTPGNPMLLYGDFVPQAEVNYSADLLKGRFTWQRGCDDLDYFEGASFVVDGKMPFTIKHYRGYPKDQFTIFFEKTDNMRAVSGLINKIVGYLEIPSTALIWMRSDDPLR